MTEEKKPTDEIRNEFERLGENIRQAVHGAWDGEERKRISKEINDGLIEIGAAFTRIGDEIAESPGVQRVREEVDDFGERIQSGEVGKKINDELVSLLQTINQKLDVHIKGPTEDNAPSESKDEG
ncbi:MAG TPA: hypothetical protein VMX56_03610 [Anaerolineales bacterium]|nr:hypothetical protein [Anaerolineales bacterium]